MNALQTILGKGWANILVSEPKDDKWSYGIGKLMVLVALLGTIYFFLSTSYQTTEIKVLAALILSAFFLIVMFAIANWEEKHENSTTAGFYWFGSIGKFLLQISAGTLATVLLIIYLSHTFCTEPRLVAEGYCVQTTQGQSGVLGNSSSAMPFYGVILAPITEELFFRVFLFATLLAMLPTYFGVFKNLKTNYPIVYFLLLSVIVNSAFGLYHIWVGTAECAMGDVQCIVDRVWISNIYGVVWLIGNMMTGGVGFSIAGHILNNMTVYKTAIPDLLLYVIVPLVIIGAIAWFILKRRKK